VNKQSPPILPARQPIKSNEIKDGQMESDNLAQRQQMDSRVQKKKMGRWVRETNL